MAEEDDGTPAPDVGDAPLPLGAELQDDLAVNYFRPLIRNLYVCKLSEVQRATGIDFRTRNITHMCIMANQQAGRFPRVVQMSVTTVDANNMDMLSHTRRLLAFVENGRDVGGVLLVDKSGGAEAAYLFLAILIKMGLTLVDALKYMKRRHKSARANAGFESQLQVFEQWPGMASQQIKPDDLRDLFPDIAEADPAAAAAESDSDETVVEDEYEEAARIAKEKKAAEDAAAAQAELERIAKGEADGSQTRRSRGNRTARSAKSGRWAARRRSSIVRAKIQAADGLTWYEYEDDMTGNTFYHNPKTNESRWLPPEPEFDFRGRVVPGTEPITLPGVGDTPMNPDEQEGELSTPAGGAGESKSPGDGDSDPDAAPDSDSGAAGDSGPAPPRAGPARGRRRSSITIQARGDMIWQELYDMDALRSYWYNRVTGESTWERPPDSMAPLPEGAQVTEVTAVWDADDASNGLVNPQSAPPAMASGVDNDVPYTGTAGEDGAADDAEEPVGDTAGGGESAAQAAAVGDSDSSADERTPRRRDSVDDDSSDGEQERPSRPQDGDDTADRHNATGAVGDAGAGTETGGQPDVALNLPTPDGVSVKTGDTDGADLTDADPSIHDGATTARSQRTVRTDLEMDDDETDAESVGGGSTVSGRSGISRGTTASRRSRKGAGRSGTRADAAKRRALAKKRIEEERAAAAKKKKPPRVTRFLYNEALYKVSSSGNAVYKVYFYRDGDHCMTADADGNTKLSIWRSGGLVARMAQSPVEPTHRAWCLDAIYSPRRQDTIYTVSFNGDAKVWENPAREGVTLSKGRDTLPTLLQHLHGKLNFEKAPSADPRAYRCCSISIARDESMLCTTSETGHLRLYGTPAARADTSKVKVPLQAWIAGFSLLATYKGVHYDWDSVGNPVGNLLTRAQFSPDIKYLATAGLDGRLCVWTKDLKLLRTLPSHRSPRRCSHAYKPKNVKLDPSVVALVAKRAGGNLKAERRKRKKEEKRLRSMKKYEKDEPDNALYDIAWNAKSNAICVGSEGGFLSMYNVRTGKRMWRTAVTQLVATEPGATLGSTSPKATGGAGGPDSKKVVPTDDAPSGKAAEASGESKGGGEAKEGAPAQAEGATEKQKPHKTKKKRTAPEVYQTRAAVNSVEFSPNQAMVVAGTADSWVKVYNADTGFLLCSIDCEAEITHVSFNPISTLVAAATANGKVSIFEIRNKMSAVTRICEESSDFKCAIL